MSLELLKVLVQPVALERDADGKVLGEKVGEAVAFYDLSTVQAYVDELREQIEKVNGASP